jgi:hypothetical protein
MNHSTTAYLSKLTQVTSNPSFICTEGKVLRHIHFKHNGTQHSKVKTQISLSRTLCVLRIIYHMQASQTNEFYGCQLKKKTERQATNSR